MVFKEEIQNRKRRGDCFRLFAACFYKPNQLIFIEENVFQNLTSLLDSVCPEAAFFSKKMGESFSRYSEQELTVEYAKLFVGPYEIKAPPYGSLYLDNGRKVMNDSTLKVQRMYEEEGLSLDEQVKELPDHIRVEFEFVYYLIYKEVEAIEKSEMTKALEFREKQKVFLETFLRPWVPVFCAQLRDSTDNEFYTALANGIECFLQATPAEQA